MTNKEILIQLYEEAKDRRIVLNQSEFAKKVGFSRIHLFKNMKTIPDSVIDKARQLLKPNEKTDFVNKEADVGEQLSRLIERSILHEATLDVLLLSIESILEDLKGKSISLVSAELQQAIKMRADKLFDEFLKKR